MAGFADDDFDPEASIGWGAANAAYETTRDVSGTGIVPAGVYLAAVEKVWPDLSANKKAVLRVRFRIASALAQDDSPEAQKGQSVLLTLNLTAQPGKEFALARTRQFEEAVGFIGAAKQGATAEDLAQHAIGEVVRITTTVGTYNGNERTQVDKIASASKEDAAGYAADAASDTPWGNE